VKRWISDYRVQSTLAIEPADKKLRYVHPENIFEVHISENPAADSSDEDLSVQIILSAPDISAAEKETQTELQNFLHLLSFITSSPFKITRRLSLIDWTPGLSIRDLYAYGPKDDAEKIAAMSSELLDTASTLHLWGSSPLLDTSLRWYAAGVRSKIMEDQFQFFWFVIELIATATKSQSKVPDKCPRCGGELFCTTCQEIPHHRPYEKQKIAMLLDAQQLPQQMIDDLFYVRNSLLHGTPREIIEDQIQEREPEFSFDKIVDLAGRLAWTLIFNAFEKPSKCHSPKFLQVSTYVNWTMTMKAHMQMGVQGDPLDPQIEGVTLPTISLIRHESLNRQKARRNERLGLVKGWRPSHFI